MHTYKVIESLKVGGIAQYTASFALTTRQTKKIEAASEMLFFEEFQRGISEMT